MTQTSVRWANRTYQAEWDYFHGLPVEDPIRRTLSDTEAAQLVERALGAEWSFRRSNGWKNGACYLRRKIISLGGLAEKWILLHEIAHALTNTPNHDSRFRGHYIATVSRWHSAEHANGLMRSFDLLGLKYLTPPHPTDKEEINV